MRNRDKICVSTREEIILMEILLTLDEINDKLNKKEVEKTVVPSETLPEALGRTKHKRGDK